MLKKILLFAVSALVLVIGGILVYAATQPDHFVVERSGMIDTAPDKPYEQVADFTKWKNWSPWETVDPNMKQTFDGTPGAIGSSYAWEGNSEVGSGKMTLTELKPNEVVKVKLEFFKPMEGISPTTFTFTPEGGKTKVQWRMEGDSVYIAKVMCTVMTLCTGMTMDKMCGDQFEKGLAQLKTMAETGKPAPTTAAGKKSS